MSLLSIDTLCDRCGNREDTLVPRASAADWDTLYTCDQCGERGVRRIWSAPNLTKESYPDGYRRGGDYQLLKEAAKLETKAASAPAGAKFEMKKAVAELRKATQNEKGKTR
jgi:hypothetical protein